MSPVRYQPSCSASRVASSLPQYSQNTLGPRTAISPGVFGGSSMPESSITAASQHRPGRGSGAGAGEPPPEPGIDRDRAGFGRAIDLKHRHPARGKTIDQMRRYDG